MTSDVCKLSNTRNRHKEFNESKNIAVSIC